jgi:LmbE family N-acetylglucosaminyl deacetylase
LASAAILPDACAEQKRREATAAATALGAEVMFGPYHDGEIPDSDDARRYVAGIIRQARPTRVITHWRKSMHKDHAATSAIFADAMLLASLDGILASQPVWRGVRSVWYAENWEDAEGFSPYIYVDVTGSMPRWRDAVTKYEFVRGGVASFN